MTKEEYLEQKKINEAKLFSTGDPYGMFQSNINDITDEYILSLETLLDYKLKELKSAQNQILTMDEIIKKAELKLGQGFWQN